jgi:NAD(P)-dependent dehydrogenase (short-subunit alcohol dehydrogenase family)
MSFYDMSGQVVMISGISGQVGQVLVSEVLKRGGKVLGIDISMSEIQKVTDSCGWNKDNVHMLEADIRNIDDVVNAFQSGLNKFGKVTSQINNAGVSVFTPWTERLEEDFDLVMDVNLKGTFNCMKVFMEYCINKSFSGAIVNVASHYGLISPDPKIYTDCLRRSPEVYGATKAGVIQMTKYFSVNAIADGAKLRINAVAPGGIRNPWDPQGADFQQLYSERCPMGRLAELEEMVGPILFLLSEDASYINGHTLVVDGGMTAW